MQGITILNGGRFINGDGENDTDNILGNNLYLYCNNNPINFEDSTGTFAIPSIRPAVRKAVNFCGFAWDKKQGIFYSLQSAKQRYAGYCDLYNMMAPAAGMFIQNKQMSFNYGGEKWMIWLWKGQYGVTTGAEIGVYIYDKNIAGQDWYRCASDDERLSMSVTLYKNGRALFSRSDYTWWLTGFKPGISFGSTLRMSISITFPNLAMANAFRTQNGFKASTSRTVKFSW